VVLVVEVVDQVLARLTEVLIEVPAVAEVAAVLVFLLAMVVIEGEDGLVMKMKLQAVMMAVLVN
tara:strand:- start:206 stop:397 length:192 start_codon:yes stop_codon:yes gene_type:complete